MDFKFGMWALMHNPDMINEKMLEKGAWPGSRDPVNFLGVKY